MFSQVEILWSLVTMVRIVVDAGLVSNTVLKLSFLLILELNDKIPIVQDFNI